MRWTVGLDRPRVLSACVTHVPLMNCDCVEDGGVVGRKEKSELEEGRTRRVEGRGDDRGMAWGMGHGAWAWHGDGDGDDGDFPRRCPPPPPHRTHSIPDISCAS